MSDTAPGIDYFDALRRGETPDLPPPRTRPCAPFRLTLAGAAVALPCLLPSEHRGDLCIFDTRSAATS